MLIFGAVELSQPSLNELPSDLLGAARQVAESLSQRGHRSWIVGGAVRDLCMGRTPADVDLTTDATPDEVEACFPMTVPLGRRFGTVLVKVGGLGIEVTTLRAEAGYGDARRPDEVVFGTSVLEDAERRDFTCNAMYLDPLTGEFLDPARGLVDLSAGRLVAVGDPLLRFKEDGLRIFRRARFAATLGLEPSDEPAIGASAAIDSIRGVSGERVMAELERGLSSGRGEVMIDHLCRLGVHRRLFPSASPQASEACLAVCRELERPLDLLLGLIIFVDPDPLSSRGEGRGNRSAEALDALGVLRPSRAIKADFTAVWRLAGSLEMAAGELPLRGDLLLWMREPSWGVACELAIASLRASSKSADSVSGWRDEQASLSPSELFPEPWIGPDQLNEVGLAKGPQWSLAMAEGLRMQLGGELESAEDAMRWLRSRVEP